MNIFQKNNNILYKNSLLPIWLLALLLICSCSGPLKVVKVIDGDTIVVQSGITRQKVRLKGVDAPEIPNSRYLKKGDPFGWESRQCLMEMLSGRRVRLEYDTTSRLPERDQYGRLLAYVYVDEELINALLIRQGCARAFLKYPHSRMEEFKRREVQARKEGLGIWSRK